LSVSAVAVRLEDRVAAAPSSQEEMLRRIVLHCKEYQGADLTRSLGQASLALTIYGALIALMFVCIKIGAAWVLLLLAPLAAGILVKLFTIQHDCGHGSFFKSRMANNALGFFISILTFTPYGFWRDAHNRHHASSGHLDKRGIGAVDTLTVDEFEKLSPRRKFLYRAYRHPAVLILLGAPVYFFLIQRIPFAGPMPFTETYQGLKTSQIWKSVMALNAALFLFYGGLSIAFGVGAVAMVVLPVVTISAWAGTWLFFVQHQYEDTYWARGRKWNYTKAAIFGSSHYDLPKVLHWFSGNIGFHHIHHLSSLIPNYRLSECFHQSEDLKSLPRLSVRESLMCARLALWDEANEKMVPFGAK
jgi:omega-6 fatty acid desaturase (delta-12 desaturase)